MVTINHHLTQKGLDFFSSWFDTLLSKIKNTDGYLDIGYQINSDKGLVRIFLFFENNDKLTKWATSDIHLNLIKNLDVYRTKPWDSIKQIVSMQSFPKKSNAIELVGFQLCPFTQRAMIILDESNITYKVSYIDISNKPDWFFKISPLHEIPVLRINDQQSIFKSNVICEYINDEFLLNLYPASNYERSRQKSWIEFGNALVVDIFLMSIAENNNDFIDKKETVDKKLLQLDKEISNNAFSISTSFSMIDSCYTPIFVRLNELSEILDINLLGPYRYLTGWRDNLLSRQSAIKLRNNDQKLLLINFLKKKNSFIVT